MRVSRWLSFIPLFFLLQVTFCGQQELDTALLTIEALDGDGAHLSEARFVVDGAPLDLAPPFDLELDPWVSHRVDVVPLEGWVFLPSYFNVVLEPGSIRTVTFQFNSLIGVLNVGAHDLWDVSLEGPEVYIDGVLQDVTAPGRIELPAGILFQVSLAWEGWEFDPDHFEIELGAESEEGADFLGIPTARVVVAEDFSNIDCNGCPEAEEAVWEAVGEAAGEMLPLSFHLFWPSSQDPLYTYTREVNNERWFYYGGYAFGTLPNVFVDGSVVTDPQDSAIILEEADERFQLTRKVVLKVESERDGGEVTVRADGYVVSDLSGLDLRIFYGLAEANVHLENGGSNGQTHFQNVVRHMNGEDGEFPPYSDPNGQSDLGEPFTTSQHSYFTFSTSFAPDFEIVDAEQLFAFVFVQAEGSLEILDAAQETHGGP